MKFRVHVWLRFLIGTALTVFGVEVVLVQRRAVKRLPAQLST